MQDMEG
jgi:hypothetical protein